MSSVKQEVERKFRVDLEELPFSLDSQVGVMVLQGYLALSENGNEVRLRDKGGEYYLTVKGDGDISRPEVEVRITDKQFSELWPMTAELRVEKVRYEIPLGDYTLELDIFLDRHDGLVLAEIEFPNADASESFDAPNWLGEDVTRDKRYKNKMLALKGVPQD